MDGEGHWQGIGEAVTGALSVLDDGGEGFVDAETLAVVLQTLKTSIKKSEVDQLLLGAGLPCSGPVKYAVLVRWLFSDVQDRRRPAADVFVHGSGDCDQLGLGDLRRERRKPTLVRSIQGVQVLAVACGGMHTSCISHTGQLYSWGCNDDGALGRPSGPEDCEPREVPFASRVVAKAVACGDSHTCMLTPEGHVWVWGTYRDPSGFAGVSNGDSVVLEKSCEPMRIVSLEHVVGITSGANHTVALSGAGCFSWGSNAFGQLGLQSHVGCDVHEEELRGKDAIECFIDLQSDVHSSPGDRFQVSLRLSNGCLHDVTQMGMAEIEKYIHEDAVVLRARSRNTPEDEKRKLLKPQLVVCPSLAVSQVFASSDCTFLIGNGGAAHGCGLNQNGQVGIGFMSHAVLEPQHIRNIDGCSWIGGGVHMSAALLGPCVYTWGRAEDCGHGLFPGSPPVLQPTLVKHLPAIRVLRCGASHALACSEAGTVFVWGCGMMHQLGNRPRDFTDPQDANDDPEDELVPYCISSAQLVDRRVLFADGGAHHSVLLAEKQEQAGLEQVSVVWEKCQQDEHTGSRVASEPSTLEAAKEKAPAEKAPEEEIEIVETREDFWRVQLESIYRRRNPYKLPNVPKLLEKYKGREAELYVKVCKVYDLNPSKFYADPEAWVGEEEDCRADADDGSEAKQETSDAWVMPVFNNLSMGAAPQGADFPSWPHSIFTSGVEPAAALALQPAPSADGLFVFGTSSKDTGSDDNGNDAASADCEGSDDEGSGTRPGKNRRKHVKHVAGTIKKTKRRPRPF